MRTRDVVVVGASAGGVESLRVLVAGLPADLPATVLVVLHVASTGSDALAHILDRAGPLPARTAVDGEPLPRSTVLVAAPDRHLLVADDHVVLSAGPRENGHRPAVDALFRSAARTVGRRAIGVVLSGTLDDGSAGLLALRARGGVGVVQEPTDALFAAMPRNALVAAPEHVLPVAELPALLDRLTREALPEDPAGEDDAPERSDTLDSALSAALRSLDERAALHRELARRATASGRALSATRFRDSATEDRDASRVLRELLTGTADPREEDDE